MTAFDPFGGERINPAWEAVQRIPEEMESIAITKLMVPTVFDKSAVLVTERIRELCPDVVICVGQAGGRAGISIERVAINCKDARTPDNEGNQPIDEPVSPDGPAAYFSTLPIKEMVEAIRAEGIPASVSNTAGTFVCNQLMYGVLHAIELQGLPTRAGFIHVPYIPAQVVERAEAAASMATDDIVRGLTAGIQIFTKVL